MELPLQERIREQIAKRRLLRPRQSVLIAVSGGADSMVLLHVVHELATREGWNATVAHLNHQLRGRSSDADERLVRRIAARLGLPVEVSRVDVKAIARRSGLSIEMAARKIRHEFFATTARTLRIPTVALAHHADDQLELFFLRILRGTGTQGLGGMRWMNASPADGAVQLIRPLLNQTKEDLLGYARETRIRYREDATNASLDIARNRVRHELLPLLLKRYQPALRERIVQLMDIFRAESELIGDLAREWSREGRTEFEALPIALQRRILHAQLLVKGLPADFDLIERLRCHPNTKMSLVRGVAISRNNAGKITEAAPQAGAEFSGVSMSVTIGGSVAKADFGGVRFTWRLESCQPARGVRFVTGRELFDAEQIGTRVILRHWRRGDRFQPIGMDRAVKVQDLFVNQKVPRQMRHKLIVATTSDGAIFWVEGLRIGDRFKLTRTTKRRLDWSWRRE